MTSRAIKKLVSTLAAAWMALGIFASPAAAHAIVTNAVPAAGGAIEGPNVVVRIQFNSRIDVARSRLTIDLPTGKTQVLMLRPESGPDNLVADAISLSAGAYKLHWQVLSVDGHISRGDVPFRVTAPDH
jgi:methionine-rich copper-binding protein CopC